MAAAAATAPYPAPQLHFLIAGVQKGGTTALGNHLRQCSPYCCLTGSYLRSGNPEEHCFDTLSRQPSCKRQLQPRYCNRSSPLVRVGAEDPYFIYVFRRDLALGMTAFAPRLKLILLLREPVQRAFSQFSMRVLAAGHVIPTGGHPGHPNGLLGDAFFLAMQEEVSAGRPSRPDRSHIAWRGFYGEQLERLHTEKPAAWRIHVAISEQIFSSESQRDAAYNKILEYLGVPTVDHFDPVFTRPGNHSALLVLTPHAARLLRRLYVNDTNALYARLGFKVTEWETWYAERRLSAAALMLPGGARDAPASSAAVNDVLESASGSF